MHSPSSIHIWAVKCILRYINGITNFGIRLLSQGSINLYGFSYVDWAGCLDTRRSTTGYYMLTAFLGVPSNKLW